MQLLISSLLNFPRLSATSEPFPSFPFRPMYISTVGVLIFVRSWDKFYFNLATWKWFHPRTSSEKDPSCTGNLVTSCLTFRAIRERPPGIITQRSLRPWVINETELCCFGWKWRDLLNIYLHREVLQLQLFLFFNFGKAFNAAIGSSNNTWCSLRNNSDICGRQLFCASLFALFYHIDFFLDCLWGWVFWKRLIDSSHRIYFRGSGGVEVRVSAVKLNTGN